MEILNTKDLFTLCALRPNGQIKVKTSNSHDFTIKHWKYLCDKLIELGFDPNTHKYDAEYKALRRIGIDTIDSEKPGERVFHIKDGILPTLCDSNGLVWYSPSNEGLEYNYIGVFIFEGKLSNVEDTIIKKFLK